MNRIYHPKFLHPKLSRLTWTNRADRSVPTGSRFTSFGAARIRLRRRSRSSVFLNCAMASGVIRKSPRSPGGTSTQRLTFRQTTNDCSFHQSARPNRIRMQAIGTFGPSRRPAVSGVTHTNLANRLTRRTMTFISDRDSQPGHIHIYRARLTNGTYEQPEKLGPEINSGDADVNPYISPDQKFLIFASYRKDNLASGGNHYGRADLYITENREGHWTPARRLEHGINTSATEANPTMSPDGKWFYFTSERSPFEVPMKQQLTAGTWGVQQQAIENGVGNIYRIPIEALELGR